jgi:glycosyltransferase involved in cell wall biosynthesis
MKNNGKNIIKLVSSNHSPFDTRIFEKEAKSLVNNGYSVGLVIPNNQDIYQDGIKIISVKPPETGWEKLFITPFRIFNKAIKLKGISCYHIHDSELLFIGMLLKLFGKKVIYDAHEDTPLQLKYQHWIPNFIKPFFIIWYRFLEWLSGKIFDGIIVAEPVIAKYYPKEKTYLIRNFPITSIIPKNNSWEKRNNQMVYIGSITKVRGLQEMLNAYAKIGSNVEFILGGKFSPESLKESISEKNGVKFLSWLTLDEVNIVLSESKLGLIIPHPIQRYLTNFPVKLFEYMLAGLPVIVIENSLSAEFVKEADCGYIVDPFNENQVAESMSKVFENDALAMAMGERGRKLIIEKYNWENESKTLISFYNALLKV